MDAIVRALGGKGVVALDLANAPRKDDGYFGPGSVSWRVYQNPMVIGLAGLLGSIIAMLDPIGAAGVAQNSSYMSDPLGRIRRSNAYFIAAVFGDTETAEKAGRDLFRRHSHVNGVVPSTGESYRANDIEALKYTYITGFPCLWDCYTAFSGDKPTNADERQFWDEHVVVGELLGIPRGVLPRTPELVAAWVRDAEENIMAYTEPAQELVDYFLHPPLTPAWPMAMVNPFLRAVTWVALSQMRPGAREVTGIPEMRVRTAAVTPFVRTAAALAGLPVIDDLVAIGGYEAWGIRHNAKRRHPGTGRIPYDRDLGLALQQGKGGTLTAAQPTVGEPGPQQVTR